MGAIRVTQFGIAPGAKLLPPGSPTGLFDRGRNPSDENTCRKDKPLLNDATRGDHCVSADARAVGSRAPVSLGRSFDVALERMLDEQ